MLEVQRVKIHAGSPEYESFLRKKWVDLYDHLMEWHGMDAIKATAIADIDQAKWRARFEK